MNTLYLDNHAVFNSNGLQEVYMEYSEFVMDHFKNPRNKGVLKNPDGIGEVGNPICGDMMKIMIKVKDKKIADIKFSTLGCGAAIAVSSIVTDMAKGKTLDEAMKITNQKVAETLGELPKNELHCANLGADALHMAIIDYYNRIAGKQKDASKEKVDYIGKRKGRCYCPYCDSVLINEALFCSKCGKAIKGQNK